jgi:pSer/pThr/pTyr-binding forkhead associated (FHA) protein
MIKKVLRALDKDASPSLEVLNGVAEGKKILFTDDLQEIDIGRDPKCSLFIDDPVISRRHAKLIRKWGGIVLLDLESRNGSFVNNEKVQEKLLRDGDKIMLGTIKLLYRNPQDVNIEAITQEISRKKKEALLREAEMMEIARKKQEEEETKAREEEEKASAQKAEEEKVAAEKAEEAKKATEAAPAAQASGTQTPQGLAPIPPSGLAAGAGLSMLEKSLIGVGGVVLLLALIGIVTIMLK